LFQNTQMFFVAGADVIIEKEKVGSGFKECERMNGFKPCIRKVHSTAEEIVVQVWRCEIRTHRSDLNSHYTSKKHQRNAVLHAAAG